ncbi:hypothetical protein [uncultured Deinococcus sp.]|uniref:hypothetical protein n=1 Tax=uncultured Deinococcus sp. TaxID=158789 RepID=UPI00258C72BF|nr:hypothetical protein [uncultured Deinococcus sp.]
MTELARLKSRRPETRGLLLGLALLCSGTAWGLAPQQVLHLSLQVEARCEVAGQTPDVLTLRCTRGYQPTEEAAALLGLATSPLQPVRLLGVRRDESGGDLVDYRRLARPEGYQLNFY